MFLNLVFVFNIFCQVMDTFCSRPSSHVCKGRFGDYAVLEMSYCPRGEDILYYTTPCKNGYQNVMGGVG